MQNINTILTSIPNNPHYLNRYIKFITSVTHSVGDYTENHHVCPAAGTMFPQYKSLKQNPWNLVKLTARQHFIAHWLLWKSYNNAAMTWAFTVFKTPPKQCKYRYSKFTSKTFELLRKSLGDQCGDRFRGKKQSPEVIAHRAKMNTGKTRPPSAVATTALKNKGSHYQSQENKDAQSQRMKSRIMHQCPHCFKECDFANYNRWHGQRCKFANK
jgi:hypothetical protein